MNKKDLWLRLKSYHFDHVVAPGLWEHITAKFGHTNPSVKAFAGKIARKHGWKNHFTTRALVEYKKFIYLGIISDFQVTPSRVIDVVWHEHLLFSKAYRDFCNEVIQQSFDHHPELMPLEDQTGRFSVQYLDTVELYRKEFDVEPPADIWGNTKFNKEQQDREDYQSKKKQNSDRAVYDNSVPLYSYFETGNASEFPEFSGFGDGEFGGGGAGGGWGEGSSADGASDSGGDGGGCSGGCGGGD